MTKRNRAQRRAAWAAATPQAIEAEFQKALRDRYRDGGHTPDIFGRKQASSKTIADAMHTRGSIEKD